MAHPKNRALQRWRLLLIAILSLFVVAFELSEHAPVNLTDLEGDFLREVVTYGIAFPVVIDAVLIRISRSSMRKTSAPMDLTASPMTDVRQVFVVENTTLLGAGLTSLLSRVANLQVSGMTPQDEMELLQAIRRVRPDVIILDETTTDAIRIGNLLQDFPNVRILVLSLEHKLMRAYKQDQVIVTQAADLTAYISHGLHDMT